MSSVDISDCCVHKWKYHIENAVNFYFGLKNTLFEQRFRYPFCMTKAKHLIESSCIKITHAPFKICVIEDILHILSIFCFDLVWVVDTKVSCQIVLYYLSTHQSEILEMNR